MARVDAPTNTNTDWTKTKSRPRHWFTRTGLTNGRHAKRHTTRHATLVSTEHKHEHQLDEDEISPTSLVHTYRADQWASCKATHNSTRNPRVDRAQTRTPIGPRRNKATSLVHTRNPRVDTTNTNTDSTKTKSRPRHWFTRTGLTDGRHAKLHTALRWCRSTGSGSARRQGRPARRRPRTPCSGTT
jgi:hypothetical protein